MQKTVKTIFFHFLRECKKLDIHFQFYLMWANCVFHLPKRPYGSYIWFISRWWVHFILTNHWHERYCRPCKLFKIKRIFITNLWWMLKISPFSPQQLALLASILDVCVLQKSHKHTHTPKWCQFCLIIFIDSNLDMHLSFGKMIFM